MVVCEERAGPTPIHLEPGRETAQRRGYWGVPWETRSVHHFYSNAAWSSGSSSGS